MEYFIYAQIFGVLGAIAMVFSNWQTNKNRILSFLMLDSICYFMQYVLLGALSGAFVNVISIIRIFLCKYKDKYKILQSNIILYLLLVIYLIIGIITYKGIISLLPVIASVIYSYTLWQNNVKVIRIGVFIMVLSFLIYNIFVKAYIGILIEFILLISSLFSIIKLDLHNSKYKNNKVIDKI